MKVTKTFLVDNETLSPMFMSHAMDIIKMNGHESQSTVWQYTIAILQPWQLDVPVRLCLCPPLMLLCHQGLKQIQIYLWIQIQMSAVGRTSDNMVYLFESLLALQLSVSRCICILKQTDIFLLLCDTGDYVPFDQAFGTWL